MAMSRRKDRARTPGLWIATNALPVTGGHPFYQRLNQVLDTHAFDAFVEAQCAPFYAATVGRPSLLPGTYFRPQACGREPRRVYRPRVLGQWFDGIRFYAAASSPTRSRRT